jgi:hypothetical protein
VSHNITQVDNLASVLADLQKRVRNLETASPTSLILEDSGGVKRIVAGILASGAYGLQVNPGLTTAGMSIDSSVPDIKVYDTAGTARVLIGKDASIPGDGYGMRVNDASGNDIWDSAGLVGVSKVLAYSAGLNISGGGTATTTPTTMGGSTLSFTVGGSRAVNVLCISTIYLTCNNASGASWLYSKFGAAAALSTACNQIPPTGTASTSVENLMRFAYLASIAPGTYSTFWENWTNAGTCAWGGTISGETIVLQLGS